MNKTFLFILLLLASVAVQAYEPSPVHQHYVKWAGVLPEPYKSIEIEIALDAATDDIKHFEILIDGKPVMFSQTDLAKLKDLDLATMRVWEEIFRDPQQPGKPIDDSMNDWVYLEMELGENYSIQWKEHGETKSRWGKDKVKILITKGAKGSIHINKLQASSV